jgi:alkylation response protein AidB-like acyl-CoA dehydrogenase
MATLAEPREESALEAFREEARAWLAANFPPALKGKDNSASAVEGPSEPTPDQAAWQKAMGEKGWGVPTWPREYGGGGLTRAEARVLQEEMAKIGAWNPIAGSMGVMMFGPTLLEYGSE